MATVARSTLTAIVLVAGCASKAATRCPEPAPAAAPTVATPAPAASGKTATGAVAEVVALINAGDAEALFARFSPEMKAAAPLPDLKTMLASIVAMHGKLTAVEPIEADERAGTFRVGAERGAWKLQIALGEGDVIAALGLSEPDDAAPPIARSAPAGLPFRGEWLVFWGGDRREVNQHIDHPSQRRAADLVMVDAEGKSHRGDGRALKDYYAYGQEIVAMADGVVVVVIDGVPDSVPGELNSYVATGNLIVLRHEGDVHSAYAHLIPGSLKVKVGAKVRRGQVIGLCGNSGNSSEPHLHVQFQDGPRFEKSWGIEAVFAEAVVVRDGATSTQTNYTWLKGDKVSPPASAARRAAPKPAAPAP